MRLSAMKLLAASVATMLAACGPAPAAHDGARVPPPATTERATATTQGTPDAPFRQKAPPPDGAVTFVTPKVVEAKLKSGLRVLVAPRRDLPIVSVRLVVGLGIGDVPTARAGTLSFLGSMLDQGTKKKSALELNDAFEAIGAEHGTWFDWDSGGSALKVLTDELDRGLALMAEVALEPSFPQAELERLRARRLAAIEAERSSPGVIVSNAAAAAVFGRAHPYGNASTGREIDAKKLTREELVAAYGRLFSPENAALIVCGDVTPESVLPRLEAVFGKWKARPGALKAKPPKPPAALATKSRVVFVDKPGAQSQIRLTKVGVPYAVENRDAVVVTNAILGGMFSSRINLNLREKHGYTYGARSYFVMRHGAGPFFVGAPVFAEKTGEAIKETLSELRGLRADGPTTEELALAKESLRLAMPGRFETASDVTSALAELVVQGLPLDDYEKRLARIDAVTADDVKRVANALLDPEGMVLVVVGDKKTVLPQLEPLGLGAVDERDAYGDPLK